VGSLNKHADALIIEIRNAFEAKKDPVDVFWIESGLGLPSTPAGSIVAVKKQDVNQRAEIFYSTGLHETEISILVEEFVAHAPWTTMLS